MPIIYRNDAGGIRWAFEASQAELALYRPAERNLAVKTSIQSGGDLWLSIFLPLRLGPYAYKLGYQIKNRWREHKEKFLGKAVPFVGETPPGGHGHNAEKLAVAVQKARIVAVANGGACELRIVIPTGHAMREKDTVAFHKVPANELQSIGNEIARVLESLLAGGQPVPANRAGITKTMQGAVSRVPPHRSRKIHTGHIRRVV